MRNISRNTLLITSFVFITLFILSGQCSSKTSYGQMPTADTKQVQVKDILSKEYVGKEVKLIGRITLECGSGCWFNLEDETGKIFIDLSPSNFAIPQWVGKTVIVNGKVVEDGGDVKMIAKGVTLK